MKMKHTPGPWKITDKIDGQFAYTPRIHVGPAVVYYTAGYHTAKQDSEFKAIADANARLIAAAPDLLAALERLSFAAECRDNTMGDACRLIEVKAELASANQQARAAIAKATGA